MEKEKKPSPKEDSAPDKSYQWVFDERTGWINVTDFLSRMIKLSNDLAANKNKTK